MSYNKSKAEQEWLLWKEAEEKILREKSVDEDTIQRLHTYDWEAFKAERNHIRWQTPDEVFIQQQVVIGDEPPVDEVAQLLDSIENQQLYAVLAKTEELTLQALLCKIKGFSAKEISALLGVNEPAINMRIYRLRKKLKKYF